MEYVVGRRVPIQRVTVAPFAVAASECNVISAVTLQGIHLFEVVAAVNRVEAFQFDHRIIGTPEKINAVQDADLNRATLNRDIDFSEIHDVFLDRTISADRVTDEPLSTTFRQVAWSPLGLLPTQKCILAAVSADHRVVLYKNGRWTWDEIDQPSQKLFDHLRNTNWELVGQQVKEGHSEVFAQHKSRAYTLGTMAIGWSQLFEGSWAWFVTLQRSGHLVVWKAQAPFDQVSLVDVYDLNVIEPSALRIYPGSSGNQILVFVGNHRGVVKCWDLRQDSADSKPTCNPLGPLIGDEDLITVGTIEVKQYDDYIIVITSKNSALMFHTMKFDGNGMQVFDEQFIDFPSLQISGLTKLSTGTIVCTTEDYQVNEVDLTINGNGIFQGLKVRKVNLPISPTMLCRGIATCFPYDGTAFFVLESVKVVYDHLKCRHPTNLVAYVSGDPARVMGKLESTNNLSESLIALETYKALNSANWESIWEMEESEEEDDCYLQLTRWFALLKCNACFAERRTIKDCEGLIAKAEKAAFILRLRHLQRKQAKYLEQDSLEKNEKLFVHLSCEFFDSAKIKESKVSFDRALVKKLKAKFKTICETLNEACVVCDKPIPFDNYQNGKCASGHGAPRCCASLRCCFAKTLHCKGCGAHYHPDTDLQRCILCDGTTVT